MRSQQRVAGPAKKSNLGKSQQKTSCFTSRASAITFDGEHPSSRRRGVCFDGRDHTRTPGSGNSFAFTTTRITVGCVIKKTSVQPMKLLPTLGTQWLPWSPLSKGQARLDGALPTGRANCISALAPMLVWTFQQGTDRLSMDNFKSTMGASTNVPSVCEVCGQQVNQCYDVHMVLQHPETRPKPQRPDEDSTKRKKK